MNSLRWLTLLVNLGALVGDFVPRNYGETTTEPPPFDVAQYKEYLINLKCPEIQNNHRGVKVPEIGGVLYQPSPSPSSKPMPLIPMLPPGQPLFPAPLSSPSEQMMLLPEPLPPVQPSLPAPQYPPLEPTPFLPTPLPPGQPSFAAASIPPIEETKNSYPTLPTNQQKNSSQSESDPRSEHDDHVGKKIKRELSQDLPGLKASQPDAPAEVTPFRGVVDELNEQVSGNSTSANNTEECTAPLTTEWANYNWYQVLLDNGGPPGAYLQKGLQSNLIKVSNPCARPVYSTPTVPPVNEITTFRFTHAKFEKVHRTEQVQVMLQGTPHEFVDVTGQLIWAPPNSTRRYFHMNYRKDDTGLYFTLNRQQKCVFIEEKYALDVRVTCEYIPLICDCFNGKEECFYPAVPAAGISPGLQAALVGRR